MEGRSEEVERNICSWVIFISRNSQKFRDYFNNHIYYKPNNNSVYSKIESTAIPYLNYAGNCRKERK